MKNLKILSALLLVLSVCPIEHFLWKREHDQRRQLFLFDPNHGWKILSTGQKAAVMTATNDLSQIKYIPHEYACYPLILPKSTPTYFVVIFTSVLTTPSFS